MSSLEREYTTQSQPLGGGTGSQRLGDQDGSKSLLDRRQKPFFLTSEFFVLIGMVAAIMIAAGVAGNFHSWRAWTLATVLGTAYIISRGLSKIGRGDGRFL
jgi:hypothetical protein